MAKKPKIDPKAAADKAEARSAKNKANGAAAKTATAAPKAAPAAAAKPAPKAFNSELDKEEKALFLNHMPKIKALKDRVASATADLRNAYKKAKAEGGFEKADFDYAFELETAEKEAKARAKIARNLKIAKIVGSDLGAQLDMFLEPSRVPAADRAFEEGERDAMENITAKPKYDPSTEQYRKYMEGYHSVSASRVTNGIGKIDPEAGALAEKEAKDKAKVDQQKAIDAETFERDHEEIDDTPAEVIPPKAPEPVTSGQPMTRAQFKAQQEAAKKAAAGG